MRISTKNIITKEEKVATKICNLLTDFNLDLNKVGYYLYHANPYLLYRRGIEVLESADFAIDLDEQKRIGYEENDRLY